MKNPSDFEYRECRYSVAFTRNDSGIVVARLYEQKRRSDEEKFRYAYTGAEISMLLAGLYNFPVIIAEKFNELMEEDYGERNV